MVTDFEIKEGKNTKNIYKFKENLNIKNNSDILNKKI